MSPKRSRSSQAQSFICIWKDKLDKELKEASITLSREMRSSEVDRYSYSFLCVGYHVRPDGDAMRALTLCVRVKQHNKFVCDSSPLYIFIDTEAPLEALGDQRQAFLERCRALNIITALHTRRVYTLRGLPL